MGSDTSLGAALGVAGAFSHRHDHGHCVDKALEKAVQLCRRQGARLTPLRRRVLELVWSGHRPLGAYELLEALRREKRNAAPPTVYRALDFLLDLGLVHRIEHLNAFIGCSGPDTPHAGQFLVCRSCGLAAEINDSRIDDAILAGARAAGFAVGRPTIEVEGLCPNCKGDGEAPHGGHGE